MERIKDFTVNMRYWFVTNDYKGNDPYQLDHKASKLMVKFSFLKYFRKLLKPLHVFIPMQIFKNLPKIDHPKAVGLILGGNSYLNEYLNESELIRENKFLLKHLQDSSIKSYQFYAWGSPFEWGSNPRYPINSPAICLVSPIAIAILIAFKSTNDDQYLTTLHSIANHIMTENGYTKINDQTFALHYSPLDNNLVYNSNALAGRFLHELGFVTGKQEYIDFAKKTLRFVISGQQKDGSWLYGHNSNIIDNRHTGFVLESLAYVAKYWQDQSLIDCLNKGVAYYDKNLMHNGLPKWSPEKQYPIDIHDVAQSILTYIALDRLQEAKFIADFAINKMSNGKDEFYFKYFRNGKTNKNIFYRWGQAWMYYALTKLESKMRN